MRKSDASSLKDKGMRIINIKIRDDLYKEIRQKALNSGTSTNDFICAMLHNKLIDDLELTINILNQVKRLNER